MKDKFLVILLFLLVLGNSVQAQTEKFGKLTPELVDLSNYNFDSTASAVVLFSVAKAELNPDLNIVNDVHVRIKILNENG